MNYDSIIIGIGILFAILLIKKTIPRYLVGILIALVICYGLSLADNGLLNTISFYGFGTLGLMFSVYSLIKTNWLNLIIGFFAFISFFWKVMHYPYANEIKLVMIIPIICFCLTLIKKKEYKNELSILTLFVAYELIEFINLMVQWFN